MTDQALGTARWQDEEAFAESHPYEAGSLWLGRSPATGDPIGYGDDRHALVCCGTRSGKGTTVITTNVCLWPSSLVVIDPKGEIATVAASRRGDGSEFCEGMGQKVHVLDPFRASTVEDKYRSRFNPLDAIDPKDPNAVAHAGQLADAMVIIPKDSKEPHFDEIARDVIEALILHVLTDELYEGRASLLLVRDLITQGDIETHEFMKRRGDDRAKEIDPQGLLWEAVSQNRAVPEVARIGSMMQNMMRNSSREFGSVMSSASKHTKFLGTPAISDCVSSSDFALTDLKDDPKGVSVFLTIPDLYLPQHKRWLRMMLVLMVGSMQQHPQEPAAGGRVLMLIDEFAGLERLAVVENAVAKLGGAFVTMMFVLQSLAQLREVYKENWETFFSCCGTRVFFSIDDLFTRNYVSEFIGDTEVRPEAWSRSEAHAQGKSATEGFSDAEASSKSVAKGKGRSVTTNESFQTSTAQGTSEQQTQGTQTGESTTENWGTGHSRGTQSGWQESTSRQKNWNKGSNWNEQSGTGGSASYDQWPILRGLPKALPIIRGNEKASLSHQESESSGGSKSRGGSEGTTKGVSGGMNETTTVNEGGARSVNVGRQESTSLGRNTTYTQGHTSSRGESITENLTVTEGLTNTHTVNHSETTSDTKTLTAAINQSVQKRRLITGDEIGERFDRPENGKPAYALVLLGGSRPALVVRTPYFTDTTFGWLFDPHPDHIKPPKLISGAPLLLPAAAQELGEPLGIRWLHRQGDEVEAGEPVYEIGFPGPAAGLNIAELAFASDGAALSLDGISGLSQDDVWIKVPAPVAGELVENDSGDVSYTELRVNRRRLLEAGEINEQPCPIARYAEFRHRVQAMSEGGNGAFADAASGVATARAAREAERAEQARLAAEEAQRLAQAEHEKLQEAEWEYIRLPDSLRQEWRWQLGGGAAVVAVFGIGLLVGKITGLTWLAVLIVIASIFAFPLVFISLKQRVQNQYTQQRQEEWRGLPTDAQKLWVPNKD